MHSFRERLAALWTSSNLSQPNSDTGKGKFGKAMALLKQFPWNHKVATINDDSRKAPSFQRIQILSWRCWKIHVWPFTVFTAFSRQNGVFSRHFHAFSRWYFLITSSESCNTSRVFTTGHNSLQPRIKLPTAGWVVSRNTKWHHVYRIWYINLLPPIPSLENQPWPAGSRWLIDGSFHRQVEGLDRFFLRSWSMGQCRWL